MHISFFIPLQWVLTYILIKHPDSQIILKFQVPSTKTELQAMLKKKTAIPFHKFVCPNCHNIPQAAQWMSAKETTRMLYKFKHYT